MQLSSPKTKLIGSFFDFALRLWEPFFKIDDDDYDDYHDDKSESDASPLPHSQ